jgi:hypothetical protein
MQINNTMGTHCGISVATVFNWIKKYYKLTVVFPWPCVWYASYVFPWKLFKQYFSSSYVNALQCYTLIS